MLRKRKSVFPSFQIYFLCIIRILLVLVPQSGYIHPDEFFQSVEVLAGRVFDVEYSPPWEFNTTQPIRGISIPYFTTGLSFIILRSLNHFFIENFHVNLVSPYFLLIIPRLLMVILSFSVDVSLQKICCNNNEKFESRLLILGTSYVILVYACRTFSNSIELILFALLLYFVCDSQTFSNELVRKQEYIKYRYENSTTAVEKAKFHKLKLYLVSDNYRNCLIIATIVVFGIFNRPTFIAYSIIPVFFWIYRGIEFKRVQVIQFHSRIFFFSICCLPAIIFNVIIDSFFYGYITWGEIGVLEIGINNFVVTPLNFLRYNLDSSNLEKHGLHPKYLHFIVNIPLLFNVLGVLALITLGKYVYWIYTKRLLLLPSIKSIKMLMTMSFISPVLILSIFPHQEPRFLVPVLFPLVYLHSDKILPEMERSLIKVPSMQENNNQVKNKKKIHNSNELMKAWILINAVLLIFYGFLHQGGIYYALNYLNKDVKVTPLNTELHIITSHIYSMPQSFILQKTSNKIFKQHHTKYSVKKRVFLHEEGSRNLNFAIMKLKNFFLIDTKNKTKVPVKKFYLLVTNSRVEFSKEIMMKNSISMNKVESFWPHLSLEALPLDFFTKYCFNPVFIFYKNCQVLSLWDYMEKLNSVLKLDLYELNFNNMI